jgi:hypothetical protein
MLHEYVVFLNLLSYKGANYYIHSTIRRKEA